VVRRVLEWSESISDFCYNDHTLWIAQRETRIGNQIDIQNRYECYERNGLENTRFYAI